VAEIFAEVAMKRAGNLWPQLVSFENLLGAAKSAAPFRDRVVHHALTRVLQPIFERRFAANLKYVWIPPGSFEMGCSRGDNECADDEKPAHQVTISKGFWIGQAEVTVAAYQEYSRLAGAHMETTPALSF